LTVGYETGGTVTTMPGIAFSLATTCQTDTFTMSGEAGGTPPVICGTNSGYHGKCSIYFKVLRKGLSVEFLRTVYTNSVLATLIMVGDCSSVQEEYLAITFYLGLRESF
jgi:hypothetical protein